MNIRTRAAGALALAGALVLVPASTGFAASLAGISSASLYVQHGPGTLIGAMSDDFTGPGKSDLAGRTLVTGQAWSAPTKTLEATGGELELARGGLPITLATLPWMAIPTTRISADLGSSGSHDFGLAIQANQAAATATVLRIMPGNVVRLARLDGGSWTTLASATAGPNGTWVLQHEHGTYTVKRNGTPLLTYTATPAERLAWGAYRDAGVYVSGNKGCTWDNLTVESP